MKRKTRRNGKSKVYEYFLLLSFNKRLLSSYRNSFNIACHFLGRTKFITANERKFRPVTPTHKSISRTFGREKYSRSPID